MASFRHYLLADCCAKVYDDNNDVLSYRETDIKIYEMPDDPEVKVIAVRGTEFSAIVNDVANVVDILRDIRFFPWQCPSTSVWAHKGFMKGAFDWERVYHKKLNRSTRYIVTGHSLGAAIAPHLARYLLLRGYLIDEVVVFGEPGGHYWGSLGHYSSLEIPTTSYRVKNDWIRFAGFGRRTVDRIILGSEGTNMWESHDISLYRTLLFASCNQDSKPRST